MRATLIASIFLCIGCSSRDEVNRRHAVAPTPDEAVTIATRGTPIIDAIYRFHHENGIWPMDLNELDPTYYPSSECKEWIFQTRYDGYWTLANMAGFPNAMVRYRHSEPPDGDQWEVAFGDFENRVDVAYAPPAFNPLDTSEVAKKFNDTVRKRIVTKPREAIHYKGAICRFYKAREFDMARELCCDCINQWPDLWWPNTVLCLVDIERGKPNEATERLLMWVRGHDDFQHWFIAAFAYDKAGMANESLAALRQAAKSDLGDMRVKHEQTGEHFGSLGATNTAHYAALLAYEKKKPVICLEVCACWERFLNEKRSYGNPGFLVFQAACYLNMKELSNAKSAIDRAVRPPPPNFGFHLDTEIARLRKAIDAGDVNYHFDPIKLDAAKMPATWQWLQEYE